MASSVFMVDLDNIPIYNILQNNYCQRVSPTLPLTIAFRPLSAILETSQNREQCLANKLNLPAWSSQTSDDVSVTHEHPGAPGTNAKQCLSLSQLNFSCFPLIHF